MDRGKYDAIALLKSDHRQVEKLFAQFRKSTSKDRKFELAEEICIALRIHTRIEEEIFYPAFLVATGNKEIHHEAWVEHAGAKKLIGEIESTSPREDYFNAKVSVLAELVRHHVEEEEKPGGMFSEARKSGMDLEQIGRKLKARKDELEGNGYSQRAIMAGGKYIWKPGSEVEEEAEFDSDALHEREHDPTGQPDRQTQNSNHRRIQLLDD